MRIFWFFQTISAVIAIGGLGVLVTTFLWLQVHQRDEIDDLTTMHPLSMGEEIGVEGGGVVEAAEEQRWYSIQGGVVGGRKGVASGIWDRIVNMFSATTHGDHTAASDGDEEKEKLQYFGSTGAMDERIRTNRKSAIEIREQEPIVTVSKRNNNNNNNKRNSENDQSRELSIDPWTKGARLGSSLLSTTRRRAGIGSMKRQQQPQQQPQQRGVSGTTNCLVKTFSGATPVALSGAATVDFTSVNTCALYYFEVFSSPPFTQSVRITLQSMMSPDPAASDTVIRIYSASNALTRDDDAYDFSAVGFDFTIPNCAVTQGWSWGISRWYFSVDVMDGSPMDYAIQASISLVADTALPLTAGVPATGTWSSTTTWKYFSLPGGSELLGTYLSILYSFAAQDALLSLGTCPTLTHYDKLLAGSPDDGNINYKVVSSAKNETVWIGIPNFDPTSIPSNTSYLIVFSALPSICTPVTNLTFCNSSIGSHANTSLLLEDVLMREERAQTIYDSQIKTVKALSQQCKAEYKDHLCSLVAPRCGNGSLSVFPCRRDCVELGNVCGKYLFFPEGDVDRECAAEGQLCQNYLPFTIFNDDIPTDPSISDLGDLNNPILWTLIGEFLFFLSSFFLAVVACMVYKVVDTQQQKRHREAAAALAGAMGQ